MNYRIIYLLFLSLTVISCMDTKTKTPVLSTTAIATNLWLEYSKTKTSFVLWSPKAEAVRVLFYKTGNGGKAMAMHSLTANGNGIWRKEIQGDLAGTYYTYQTKNNGKWLKETPGIYAQAVGVNGERAMVMDINSTNPEGWETDKGPTLVSPNAAIIYELHIRDMTIHPMSGSSQPGKYLGWVEEGVKGPNGVATGIDHLKEMGITHVHLLPTYDHYSINEAKLDSAQFNWGYDPQNYNVPEGSFSSNPYKAEVRIKEFKHMVKTLHDNNIGVILDVVYNHTGRTENSNFNLEAPDYYYRFWEDGRLSDASACGNETASEKEMMRKFMLESVVYWAKEYHLDGFRFDLMGIHDITTMNTIADTLKQLKPDMLIYGEGWTAGDSPLAIDRRALKRNITEMPQVIAFSDDLRDGLKGSVFEDESTGFVSGAPNTEASIKFGVVGAIKHPEIDYKSVNYSDAPWTLEPWQAMSYVSCHDNHTLYDKLKISQPNATEEDIIAMHKLANAIVLTSQGTPFLHAGVELLRSKENEHNSYNLPDRVNQIDWSRKHRYEKVVSYYQNLIALRKAHPAFRMPTANAVTEHLNFEETSNGVISYTLSNYANSDPWKTIRVVYNAKDTSLPYTLGEEWNIAVLGEDFHLESPKKAPKTIKIPAISMFVAYQEE